MKIIHRIMILLGIIALAGAQSLDDHFRIAAERNPGLQARYKTFEIALEQAAQVAALPDPGLSFGYFISPVETRVGPQQFKLSLTQMFPWFGTLKAKRQAAALQADAAYQSFLDAKHMLYYKLASTYYPLLERDYWVKAQQELLENMQSLKILTESKVANGRGSLVNVLRIDRELEAVQSELRILEEKRKPLEAAFNALLDRDPDTPVIIADDLNEIFQIDALHDGDPFMDHPALEALDLKIKAMEFNEKVALRKGLPGFGLGLDYVAVGDRTDMVVAESGKDVLMPMISISLPLARGKYRAAVKTVRLQRERLEYQKDAFGNGLRTSYAQAEFELSRQMEKLNLLRSQIETTKDILEILTTRYAQDGSELEELLRVRREQLAYEKQLATALSNIRIAQAELLALTARVTF